MTMSSTFLLAMADRLGLMYTDQLAIQAGTAAQDVLTGAVNALAAIRDTALLTDEHDEAALLASSVSLHDASLKLYPDPAGHYRGLVSALNRRLAASGATGLNAYLTANAKQVSPDFAAIAALCGVPISPANIFPATVVAFGSYAVTGSGAGTFTDGAAIDTAVLGATQLQVKVTGGTIGAASIVATLSVKRFDGTATTIAVTIPNGSVINTVVAVGTATDRFVDVTAVSITGGTNADAFAIQAKVLRTPTL